MTTPYDSLPPELRRENWGWFGQPWPSPTCYDAAGRLLDEMRKPFPHGQRCLHCDEVFDEAAGDSGRAMPFLYLDGPPEVVHIHKECGLRQVVGSLAHLEHRCTCHGGTGHSPPPGMTLRQEAVEVWRRTIGAALS